MGDAFSGKCKRRDSSARDMSMGGWQYIRGLDTKSVIKWWGFFPDSLVYRSGPFAIDWGVACCTKGKDIVCITCRVIVL